MIKYTKEQLIQELQNYYCNTNKIPVSRTFHIHQNVFRYHFGNWNNALKEANIPIYSGKVTTKCKYCDNEIISRKSVSKRFCNRSCSASYNNKITRDHKISIFDAIHMGYDPYYITHPLNCELMPWIDNYNTLRDFLSKRKCF